MINKYWYPTAFKSWGEEEQEAIQRVIKSDWFTYGEEVKKFETEYALYHGRKYAVAVNSGSSANLVATAALFHLQNNPLKRGDKVAVPAIAWATTYAPLVQWGLDLVLLDANDSWNACPIRSFDAEGVRLVVGCSILGSPAALTHWQTVASTLGAYFLNDDCESLGAKIGQQTTGAFGLMSTSSLFMSHQISAIEGGVILTDDEECYTLCKMLRSHGWTRDTKPTKDFSKQYSFEIFGYNLRPLEMHAAIAGVQLRKLKGFIAARQANARAFKTLTLDLPIKLPVTRSLDPSPFSLHFTVASPEIRLKLVERLREKGIDSRLPTGGSFGKHVYGRPWSSQPTPVADSIHETGMFLGNAPFPIDEQIGAAVEVMQKVLL